MAPQADKADPFRLRDLQAYAKMANKSLRLSKLASQQANQTSQGYS